MGRHQAPPGLWIPSISLALEPLCPGKRRDRTGRITQKAFNGYFLPFHWLKISHMTPRRCKSRGQRIPRAAPLPEQLCTVHGGASPWEAASHCRHIPAAYADIPVALWSFPRHCIHTIDWAPLLSPPTSSGYVYGLLLFSSCFTEPGCLTGHTQNPL